MKLHKSLMQALERLKEEIWWEMKEPWPNYFSTPARCHRISPMGLNCHTSLTQTF